MCADITLPRSSWYVKLLVDLYVPSNFAPGPFAMALTSNCCRALAQCGASNRCGNSAPKAWANAPNGAKVPDAKMTECVMVWMSLKATAGDVAQMLSLMSGNEEVEAEVEKEEEEEEKEEDEYVLAYRFAVARLRFATCSTTILKWFRFEPTPPPHLQRCLGTPILS